MVNLFLIIIVSLILYKLNLNFTIPHFVKNITILLILQACKLCKLYLLFYNYFKQD